MKNIHSIRAPLLGALRWTLILLALIYVGHGTLAGIYSVYIGGLERGTMYEYRLNQHCQSKVERVADIQDCVERLYGSGEDEKITGISFGDEQKPVSLFLTGFKIDILKGYVK